MQYSFSSLASLMHRAEDRQQHGLTIMLYDDLSGSVMDLESASDIFIFDFDSIGTLFNGLSLLAEPPKNLN